MKEFIEKLIGRLEEKFKYNSEQAEIYRDGSDKDAYFREKKDLYMDRANTYGQVMRIINELAEEYKDKLDDEWQIIYNKILNLEKKYANDGNTESVNDCIKLENLLQYFKEELRSEEEYINTSTDTSSGWISCSERLPEEDGNYLVQQDDGRINILHYCKGWNCTYMDVDKTRWSNACERKDIIAWMPLPAPYKEGCE